jgi:hypothetical protein
MNCFGKFPPIRGFIRGHAVLRPPDIGRCSNVVQQVNLAYATVVSYCNIMRTQQNLRLNLCRCALGPDVLWVDVGKVSSLDMVTVRTLSNTAADATSNGQSAASLFSHLTTDRDAQRGHAQHAHFDRFVCSRHGVKECEPLLQCNLHQCNLHLCSI